MGKLPFLLNKGKLIVKQFCTITVWVVYANKLPCMLPAPGAPTG